MDDADNLRALAQRRKLFFDDPREFNWGLLCEVIPVMVKVDTSYLPSYLQQQRTILIGHLMVRFGLLGIRVRIRIMRNKDGVYYGICPSTTIKTKRGSIYEQSLSFDTVAERDFFLRWCTQVWLRALADGNGRMLPREIASEKNEYHRVKSDFSLEPNARGYWPWASTIPECLSGQPRSTYSSDECRGYAEHAGPATGYPSEGVAEGEAGSGTAEIADDEVDRILDESGRHDDGVSGVPEAVDRHDGNAGGQEGSQSVVLWSDEGTGS